MEQQKPVATITCGTIKACIWRNDTASRLFHDVTVSRRYRDSQGWTSTCSFGVKDLPVLAKVILDAHTWIHAQLSGEADATSPPAMNVLDELRVPPAPQ